MIHSHTLVLRPSASYRQNGVGCGGWEHPAGAAASGARAAVSAGEERAGLYAGGKYECTNRVSNALICTVQTFKRPCIHYECQTRACTHGESTSVLFCSVQVLFKFCSGSVLSGCNLRRGGPPTHGESTSVRMLSAPPARGMYGCGMHECTKVEKGI